MTKLHSSMNKFSKSLSDVRPTIRGSHVGSLKSKAADGTEADSLSSATQQGFTLTPYINHLHRTV